MRRSRAISTALCVLALSANACGGDDDERPTAQRGAIAFPATIDNCGAKVKVFQRPRRILAVTTAAEKLIHGAGGAELVVARAVEDAGPPPAPVRAGGSPPHTRPRPGSASRSMQWRPSVALPDRAAG